MLLGGVVARQGLEFGREGLDGQVEDLVGEGKVGFQGGVRVRSLGCVHVRV